ncbi:hypothetical protein GF359_10290 [candidate division WOR-3 bacterium]|uniref:Uncharacterized protein n=1 Tax=candidate division WOR-3 bacterium TaxID=2052148 RepID=A0A9D5KBA1_UNCW3|nr:hypothetical protein [candidate division WOR-3 bacterium]MBD3365589.1 hypothetical protein [candidate division WOR-3 bacterium]
MSPQKTILILLRSCPYGMATAAEGYRVIIGLAGMGLRIHAVLLEDGVLVALKGQNPSGLGMHELSQVFAKLTEFGADLYVHTPSVTERGLSEAGFIDSNLIDDEELKDLITSADHVITFN